MKLISFHEQVLQSIFMQVYCLVDWSRPQGPGVRISFHMLHLSQDNFQI